MYLFTMVFIFLTVFGIFTEIVALQNNRFAAMHNGGAQQFLTWHTSVLSAARVSVGGTQVFAGWGAAPCTVLATGQALTAGFPGACQDAQPANARIDALVVALPAAGNTLNLLPAGYNANTRFNSFILTDTSGTNTRLAVTFIGPPTGAGATANTPIAPIGLTSSQLYRQLLRMNVDKFTFGFVLNNQLQPAATPAAGISGIYTLPPALVFNAATNPTGPIRSGALALFTPL